MEAGKWEELPWDCLVDVLGRVGLESLLFDVPFVCKSWYKATLSPVCWKELNFPNISDDSFDDPLTTRFERQYGLQGEFCTTKFVKGVVDRSAGCATTVMLPYYYSEEALITYVADKCPALKKLVLHESGSSAMLALSSVIGKFRNLELLEICTNLRFRDIVTEIGAHCVNFVALSLVGRGASKVPIGEEEVMSIVSSLPKIKCLTLRKVLIERENLIKILKGCMELVLLDVRDCCGFDEDDEELSKLASHVLTFKCSGSVLDTLDDFDGYGSYDSDGNDSYDHFEGYDSNDHFFRYDGYDSNAYVHDPNCY